MKWEHKCSLGWLEARKDYLTATDIKELLPVTKTGRHRDVTDEQYLNVLGRKMRTLTEDDCISTGAAARGHILEPYAIDTFNKHMEETHRSTHLYHWDDIVIPEQWPDHTLAFSPDACDIKQPKDDNQYVIHGIDPKIIGEVKCYNSSKHLALGLKPKMELEERWQIATAMACRTSIEQAFLILYNPSMVTTLFVKEYNRADLSYEMDVILEVAERWERFKTGKYHDLINKVDWCYGSSVEEINIIKALEGQNKGSLNRP